MNILTSLRRKVERGDISIRSAAYRLFDAGWFNYVPSDSEVINKLHIFI